MFLIKMKFALIVVLAIGIAGAGTGFLGYRTDAESPAPQEKRSPSSPTTPAGVADQTKKKEDETKPVSAPPVVEVGQQTPDWHEKLLQSVNYSGVDDARLTLGDALDHLSKHFNLTFDINEKAFEMEDLKDAARTPIADPAPIPPMRATLATVLRRILRRVPASSGATYLIRGNVIEITTTDAVRSELGIPENRVMLPLVWDSFKETPLSQTLPRLAESSGYNVASDPHAGERLQTKITVQLNNVPIDTAVRLLANMAGLSVVKLDNVFYVTTSEKAERLRKEQGEINGETLMACPETKKPAPDKPAK